MHHLAKWTAIACLAWVCAGPALPATEIQPLVDPDGTVHVPAYTLPESSFLSSASREALKNARKQENKKPATTCPTEEGADVLAMAKIRECEAQRYYRTASYKDLREVYPVTLQARKMGGVYTEVFEPVGGIAARNKDRVLINVHGGAFLVGARTASHRESIPIAVVGGIKVVSIDYRQGPEYHFPAASDDVESVYRELLKTYKPGNIGIYGCSAGGLLTAEAVAWLQTKALPAPGAVGMFCNGAAYWTEGDSGATGNAMGWGSATDPIDRNPYFRGVDKMNPLAFPIRSRKVIAAFPPALLIAGTRDVALSSVVYTHSVLVAEGVDTDLHVWEGMGHGFFGDPALPESREVYSVIVKFFDKHLGT